MTITIFGRQFSINSILISILLLGTIFKGIYLFSYALNNPYYSIASMDSAVYVNWAQLINQEGWLGTKIFYRAPFYPYLLSIIFWFAPHNLLAVYSMQLGMGICCVVLIYLISKRIYCERAGFCLIYSPLTFFETKILPTITGEAVRELEKIIVSESQDYRLYLRAGIMLGRVGRHVRARDVLAKGLQISPEDIDLQYNYALACAMSANNREAVEMTRKIIIVEDESKDDTHGRLEEIDWSRRDIKVLYLEHNRVSGTA